MANEQIEPALSVEEWRVATSPDRITSNASWQAQALFNMYCDEYGHADYVDHADMPRMIALANAALADSDPRKITREWISVLAVAQAETRKAVGVDCVNGPCEECIAACERFCARLQSMADALESYLPPTPPDSRA